MNNQNVNRILAGEMDPAFRRRARLVVENLNNSHTLEKVTVLDVGCGRGFYEYLITQAYPDYSISAIDLNEEYLKIAKDQFSGPATTYTRANATKLPYKDKSFHFVLSSELLEHIPEDTKVISEMYRVLKKGGKAVITVPNHNYPFWWDPINWVLERVTGKHVPAHIWWLAGIWADHVRLYDEDELVEKFTTAGFKIEKLIRSTHYCLPGAHFCFYAIGKNLVEKGLLKNFYRFNYQKKKSPLTRMFLTIINYFDEKNDRVIIKKKDSYLNQVLVAIK